MPPVKQANTDWRDAFLVSLASDGNVSAAAEVAKVNRSTIYRQREDDKAFAEAWDKAKQQGLDTLEDVAVERARKGSDTLLIFLLKAHDPKRFRENIDVTSNGERLPIAVVKMDVNEL